MGADVITGHVQYIVGDVQRVDAGRRQMNGQADGDGAGARANVGDDKLGRLHPHQGHEQGVFHQRFCLGAGDQHRWANEKVHPIELPVAQDVSQRLPSQPPFHYLRQLLILFGADLHLLLSEDVLAEHPHHFHRHELRFQARVRDACRLKGHIGLPDDVA